MTLAAAVAWFGLVLQFGYSRVLGFVAVFAVALLALGFLLLARLSRASAK